jgi:hypothetical protein
MLPSTTRKRRDASKGLHTSRARICDYMAATAELLHSLVGCQAARARIRRRCASRSRGVSHVDARLSFDVSGPLAHALPLNGRNKLFLASSGYAQDTGVGELWEKWDDVALFLIGCAFLAALLTALTSED